MGVRVSVFVGVLVGVLVRVGVKVGVLVRVIVGVVGVLVRGTQLFSRMDTLLEKLFVVPRSGWLSPLKSPTATEEEYVLAGKLMVNL